MTCTLILGGARSGKSRHAEQLAAAGGKEVVYLATAQARDSEMAARIGLHRQRRDQAWVTVEEPMAIGDAIARWSKRGNLVLVDCLTVWLSNLLFADHAEYPEVGAITPPAVFDAERGKFLEAVKHAGGDLILVSNEVGMGIVPMGAISRWFADEAGRLNQEVAACCDRVQLVAAGLPLTLKG